MKENSIDLMSPQVKTLLLLSEDCIIILDADYRIVDFNEAAKSLLRWKENEMLGQSFASVYQDHPTKAPFPGSKFQAIRRGESFNFNYVMHRNKLKRYMTWKYNGQPNQPLHIIVGIDNTNKKRLALQNITIFDQIKKISTCMPGNFYWKNKESQYLGCNSTLLQTLGFKSANDIVGKVDADLWPEFAEELRENDAKVIREKTPIFLEETVNLNGKLMYFTVIKMPLLDDEGNIIGILGNSIDITELKTIQADLSIAKEAAESASRAKTEFIANMSHDIRTPLTGVVGMSRMLEESLADPKLKQYAKWLGESGKQLLHMLNEILDVVSADNVDEADLHEESFSLQQVIQDIIQLERPSTLIKGLNLIGAVDEAIPYCLISDPTKIHRVLLNLLGNAIKFTQKGQVEIHAKLVARNQTHVVVQFRIQDTGIGIPENLQDKVFDRFYRITPSHKGTYTGHGVGLHIAKSYVGLLGGKISLFSKPGKGTTFSFDLSLKIGDSTPKIPSLRAIDILSDKLSSEPAIPCSLENAPKLLLVEDNKVALFTLENLITQSGLRFVSAMDGETALNLAKMQTFDLIITDLGLPGLSGIDLTSQIRILEKETNRQAIPIIGLTAHSEERIKSDCLQSGMNEVYTKPMTTEVLLKITKTYFPQAPDGTFLKNPEGVRGNFGADIPDSEEELFKLDNFTLFDVDSALVGMGNDRNLLKSILTSIIEKETPADLLELEKAHTQGNWDAVSKLAHRMKSGFVYCGAIKLVHACQHLERYSKAGHTRLLEPLYQQLLNVVEETKSAVNLWLLMN